MSYAPPNTHRSRWAAIGAAVAVALGGGGIGLVRATVNDGPMAIYQAINPCRLADTRPAPTTVGTRDTPIGGDETWTLDGWGTFGNCTLPSDTSALELNVTALGATLPTFLQVFPAGGPQPVDGSNLNPQPGQPPTPNSVTATLADDGRFSIYNKQGLVNVIIDVVGYYEDHNHSRLDIVDEPGVSFTFDDSNQALSGDDTTVATVRIRPPSDGFVTVNATVRWFAGEGLQIRCQITDGTAKIVASEPVASDTIGYDGRFQTFSLHRTFPVTRYSGSIASGRPFNLVCDEGTGTGRVWNVSMTATYFPTSYAPITLTSLP